MMVFRGLFFSFIAFGALTRTHEMIFDMIWGIQKNTDIYFGF